MAGAVLGADEQLTGTAVVAHLAALSSFGEKLIGFGRKGLLANHDQAITTRADSCTRPAPDRGARRKGLATYLQLLSTAQAVFKGPWQTVLHLG
jgi:hypothetical protein